MLISLVVVEINEQVVKQNSYSLPKVVGTEFIVLSFHDIRQALKRACLVD